MEMNFSHHHHHQRSNFRTRRKSNENSINNNNPISLLSRFVVKIVPSSFHHHHHHRHLFLSFIIILFNVIHHHHHIMVTMAQTSSSGHPLYIDQNFGGNENEMDFDMMFDPSYTNKPLNVTVRSMSTTSISIHWQSPYEEPQGYKIKFRLKGNKKQETIVLDSSNYHHELKNLEKATSYQIKLAAIYGNETGPFTEWYTVETLQRDLDETQVPDQPGSLRLKQDHSSIHLSWTPPKNRNIVVRGYTIGWGEGVPDRWTWRVQGGDQRSYTIENATISTEYVISLRAYNLRGEGQPIYETIKITFDPDKDDQFVMLPPIGLKTTVISSSAIVLDWTDASRDSSSSIHQDNRFYLIRYTNIIHSNSPRYRYANTTKRTFLVEDLKPKTQYEFSVKVIKNKRNSTWSMTVMNTTHEAVPSTPPRDLTIVPSSNDDPTTINIHWQPPKQPNGQITGYVIFYTQDNTQEDRDWIVKVIFGDKLNAMLNGLQSSSVYYFKIQARNNKGYGPLSSEVSFRTLPATMKTHTTNGSDIQINLFSLIIIIISCISIIFLIGILKIYICKNDKTNNETMGKNRKGYIPTATSPGGGGGGKNTNSRMMNNIRNNNAGTGGGGGMMEKPPDLWIHHSEQVEMKLMDKNNGDNDSNGGALSVKNNIEQPFAKIKKTNSTYGMNTALYDDINSNKSPSSPIDNIGMATMRRSSSIRPKTSTCMDHSLMNMSMMNMEPSTGLSRPLYPKTNQFNIAHPMDTMDSASTMAAPFHHHHHHHLYDPVPGSGAGGHIALTNLHESQLVHSVNSSNSYMSSGNSSSPHSVISNNTVLTNSSTGTSNLTNSSTSPPNTSIYLSNSRQPQKPSSSMMMVPTAASGNAVSHSALKSFGVPTPPPALPSLATLGGLQNNSHNSFYNTSLASLGSPSKKFLLTTTNNLNTNNNICGSNSTLASNGKSATNFSDDHSISASYNPDELHQEMANLDNLMKDLNAMKPNNNITTML
nr:neogenin-like [Dermatophagoides farinae]